MTPKWLLSAFHNHWKWLIIVMLIYQIMRIINWGLQRHIRGMDILVAIHFLKAASITLSAPAGTILKAVHAGRHMRTCRAAHPPPGCLREQSTAVHFPKHTEHQPRDCRLVKHCVSLSLSLALTHAHTLPFCAPIAFCLCHTTVSTSPPSSLFSSPAPPTPRPLPVTLSPLSLCLSPPIPLPARWLMPTSGSGPSLLPHTQPLH